MDSKPTQSQAQKPFSCSSMFVGGFESSTSYFQIKEYFIKYGPVKRVNMVRNSKGGSKGYCFVIFEQASSVEKALNDKEEAVLNGRKLDCRPILKGKALRDHRKRINQRRICVSGLPDEMEQFEKSYLRRVYQAFGKIENFYFKRDSNGDGRGELQLLITYFQEKGATKCLSEEVVYKQKPLTAKALLELDPSLGNEGGVKSKKTKKNKKNKEKREKKELKEEKNTSKCRKQENGRTQANTKGTQGTLPYRFKVKKRERDLVKLSWSRLNVSELILMVSHRVDHAPYNIRRNRGSPKTHQTRPTDSSLHFNPPRRTHNMRARRQMNGKESSFYSNCTSDNFYPSQRQDHIPSF